jgi:hypothetical protein
MTEKRDFIFNRNIYIDFSKKENLKNELLSKGEGYLITLTART